MIVASLLLILLAVVLLVVGLAGGSSLLLIVSIAASLLAAVALVAGARQVAAGRATADPTARRARPTSGSAGPVHADGPPAEAEIPAQYLPPTVDAGGTGWRQPPEPPVTDARPRPAPGPGSDELLTDEPPAQQVGPDEAALVAGLPTPVRVVQGRPRYHLADCPHLIERRPSWLAVAEAVELGFTPCALCAPDTALLADAHRI